MAHKIMRAFTLGEISGVDRPAQAGAKALIIKRAGAVPREELIGKSLKIVHGDDGTVTITHVPVAGETTIDKGDGVLYVIDGFDQLPAATQEYLKREFSTEQRQRDASRGVAMPGGGYPIENRGDLENAIRAYGRAKNKGKTKSHIIARARSLDATSLLPDDWKVGKFIAGDLIMEIAKVAPRVLPELLENIEKAEVIEALIAKISDATARTKAEGELKAAKAALVASAWSAVDNTSGEDKASHLRKNFSAYKDHVEGLVPNDITGDDMKAIAKALGLPETATEADILKALETKNAELAKADALAKMSGKHKAFMENPKAKMPEGGKEKFQAMEPGQRDAHMAANPCGGDDDGGADTEKNCIKVDGKTIRKADVGDATFTVLKAQAESIQKMETDAAVATISKRITPIATDLIGKADDTAALLHRVAVGKSTQADADTLEKMFGSANEVVKKSSLIKQELGGKGALNFGKAREGIEAKANELLKNWNTAWGKPTIEKARVKARDQNKDLAQQEEKEAREDRKAA